MVDIQCAAAEIRQGKKEEDRKKPQGKNIMSASATQGGHNKHTYFRLYRENKHPTGCQPSLTTGLITVLNEQPLFVLPVVKPGCTTGLTTGLTTGCIV